MAVTTTNNYVRTDVKNNKLFECVKFLNLYLPRNYNNTLQRQSIITSILNFNWSTDPLSLYDFNN